MGNKPDSPVIQHNRKIYYGWFILITSFLTGITSWGFYYSFGVYFSALQNYFQTDRAQISLVSSVFIFTLYLTSMIYGWAVEKFGPRICVGFGGLLFFIGLILSSRATAIWQMYLFLGFLGGFGTSATIVPYLTSVSRWFIKMRGLTIGIQSASAGAGMMIMAPLCQKLLTNYGWQTSFVVIAIINIINFTIGALILRADPREKGLLPYGAIESTRPNLESDKKLITPQKSADAQAIHSLREIMKDRDLWLIIGMRVVLAVTIFMINTHLVNFAKDTGMAATSAAILMTIVGAVSIGGKVGAGYAADRVGSKRIVIICASLMAALMLWLSSPGGSRLLFMSTVIYGLAYGGTFPLFNTIVAERFDISMVGKIIGIVNVGSAIGSLIGPLIAGYIFDVTGSYSVAFVVAAGASLAAVILAIPFGRKIKQTV